MGSASDDDKEAANGGSTKCQEGGGGSQAEAHDRASSQEDSPGARQRGSKSRSPQKKVNVIESCARQSVSFHTLIVLSALPDASRRALGLNATLLIEFVCPLKLRTSLPVATSHSFTVPS